MMSKIAVVYWSGTFDAQYGLSTVRNADRIAVIEDEHIIEMGSHDELIAKKDIRRAVLCTARRMLRSSR